MPYCISSLPYLSRNGFEVFGVEFWEGDVFFLVGDVGAFGDCGDTAGDVPGEDDLGGGDIVFGGEGEEGGVVTDFGVACGGVGCEEDAFGVAVFFEVFLS